MATDDAMDVESATQGLYMDVEQQSPLPPTPVPQPDSVASTVPPQVRDDDTPSPPEDAISPQVAESILVARRVVVAFLRERKAEHIVPDNSRVVIVDGNLRLKQAFRALLENGVRAAPVIDTSTHEFCGMLSVSDILDSLLHLYYSRQTEDPLHDLSQGLADYTVNTWLQQQRQRHPSDTPHSLPQFRFADADAPLFDAVRLMRDGRMLHLPILSRGRTLLHTLEHWRVLRFLHRHFSSSTASAAASTGPSASDPQHATRLFNLTLSQLNVGTYSGLITIPASISLLGCLQTLQRHSLSALPVVDERNQLVEVYSRADVAMLCGGGCDGNMLQRTVAEVLRGVRGGVPFSGVTCRRADMLGTVFERFERTGVQRSYIIGEAGLEGVVSLSDLLRYFLHGF